MIVRRVVGGNFSFSRSVCMSVDSAGISRVLIKYSGKYVKIYFDMKITYLLVMDILTFLLSEKSLKLRWSGWQPSEIVRLCNRQHSLFVKFM